MLRKLRSGRLLKVADYVREPEDWSPTVRIHGRLAVPEPLRRQIQEDNEEHERHDFAQTQRDRAGTIEPPLVMKHQPTRSPTESEPALTAA